MENVTGCFLTTQNVARFRLKLGQHGQINGWIG